MSVTGLSVVDTISYYSFFLQLIALGEHGTSVPLQPRASQFAG
jgi:hypothetical protein